ncbi:hypothetical protein Q5425_18110 [Amycolatopsis sp. A133]|uniref:hypothetical protein n=1 Tax=Amycolatopsis sp. A133 TaxID=3064472 RepID=UPI0027FA1063|nr:hypothetical protein [Amycolatopsis sp. A133]MDQ7805663.1 hypothetical protein [Amycolatopsis sp. A133]
MDLAGAFKVIGTPVRLPGRSDDALVRQIQKQKGFTAPGKPLCPAEGLADGIALRPLEALHWLSYVTRPRYQDDVLDVYLRWGLLRYLGFFAHDYTHSRLPRLTLSEAGRRISGNQRRVTSEEMGIAFGTALAKRWFETTGVADLRAVVDIDVALDARYVFGPSSAVQHIGTQRPDYLLVGADPRDSTRYLVRVLECKGTKNAGHAVPQLARAVGQLDGVTIGGRVPHGLATTVITAENKTSYLAVDPGDDDEPAYEVTAETIDRVRNFRFEADRSDASAAEIAGASVRASWAVLADFGSNLGALRRWAPEVMERRIERRVRERRTFSTPVEEARGTSFTFGFDQEQLTVEYGIARSIDDSLSEGSAGAIMEAQRVFAERLRESPAPDQAGSDTVYSATADGSILSLTLERRR